MSSIDTSSWKEFKVSEVFGKAKLGKYHNPSDLEVDINGYPYICASNQNNGINAQMPRVNGKELTLTPAKIIAWGKQCPMFAYHNEPCVTSQGMYYLDMTAYSEDVALFICSVLTHSCGNGKYSYSNCLIGSIMDETVISLPVKETEEIDWEYMQERISELEQERISELEQERISELEQYLIATGLNDYELTDEDGEILATKLMDGASESSTSGSGCWKEAREFKLSEIFEKINTAKIANKANDFPTEKNGDFVIPLLTAGVNNQGLARYAKREQCKAILKNVISISANGANTGATFYQSDEFAVLQDSYAIKLKNMDIPNEYVGQFLASCISKILRGNFSWTYKAGWERVKDMKIILPVTASGTPDWSFMEKYIRAIEKVTIADVVKYKDEIIQKTKEAVV